MGGAKRGHVMPLEWLVGTPKICYRGYHKGRCGKLKDVLSVSSTNLPLPRLWKGCPSFVPDKRFARSRNFYVSLNSALGAHECLLRLFQLALGMGYARWVWAL